MSKLPEFIDISNSNFYSKLGSDEYDSRLPELEDILDQMYTTIPEYYFFWNEAEVRVNLEGYNTHYSSKSFDVFRDSYNKRHSLDNYSKDDIEVLKIHK